MGIIVQALCIAGLVFVISVAGLTARKTFQENAQQQANQQTDAHSGDKQTNTDAITRYTYWLMVFTGMLAGVGFVQLYFLTETDRIATKSANAAAAAANAAVESNRNAEQIAERQLRAYVALQSATIGHIASVEGPSMVVVLRNSGQTPAKELAYWGKWDIRPYPPVEPFDNPPPEHDFIPKNVLGGGSTSSKLFDPAKHGKHGAGVTRPLTAAERAALVAGTSAIYVWADATYRDVFGHAHHVHIRVAAQKDGDMAIQEHETD